MAKKKKEGDETAEVTSVSSIEERLKKQFGANVIVSASYLIDKPQYIVSVSPQLDQILGGGIKYGSFVIPTGPPKVGKSSMSLAYSANALVNKHPELDTELYIFNIEGRLNPRDLLGHRKLVPFIGTKIHVIGSEKGRILTAENYLDIGEQLINEKPGCIFLFDSFSQLCSKAAKEKEWDGVQFRDNTATLLSQFCKRISNVIPINESVVIGITHQIANTGFGFSPWAEASGNKIQYQVDVKLKATHCKEWKAGERVVGQDVFWECYCSPLLNGAAEGKCTSKLRYGWGIDDAAELVEICIDINLIKKKGSWYTFPDGTQFQGKEGLRDALANDPQLLAEMTKAIKELMGT